MAQMRSIPESVVHKVYTFEQGDGHCRNLKIRNRNDGQTLLIERADAPELADDLEEIVNGIRMAYGIRK